MPITHTILTLRLDQFGIWKISFFVGMCVCALTLLKKLEDLPICARILWGYCLCYALFIIEFPYMLFGEANRAFESSAGQNFAEVLVIPLVVWTLQQKTVEKMIYCLRYIALIEIVLVWANTIASWRHPEINIQGVYGLMKAPSFDLALLALFIPFAPLWINVIVVGTILTHHAGTADLILAAELLGFAIAKKIPWSRLLVIGGLTLAGFFLIALFHSHTGLLDGVERLNQYKRFMSFWLFGLNDGEGIKWPWVFFGVGPASFMWCSIMIDQLKGPVVVFLHSDWLQIVFELGLVGLALVLSVYFYAIRQSWRDKVLLPALLGVGAFAIPYHPTRFFPSAFLLAVIFRLALKGKEEQAKIKD